MTEGDLLASLEQALLVPGEQLDTAANSFSDRDLPIVLDMLQNNSAPTSANLRAYLVRHWAETDAPAAASWVADRLAGTKVYPEIIQQVAIAWANTDLPAAMDWVRMLPESDGVRNANISIGYEAARTDPISALELATELTPSTERDELILHAVSQWAASDPANATRWVTNTADSGLRQRLIAVIVVGSAESDARTAATIAANSLSPGEEQNRAIISIIQRWGQTAPESAGSWISKFPNSELRDLAAETLFAVWRRNDDDQARNWFLRVNNSVALETEQAPQAAVRQLSNPRSQTN
jgi:hypothetical protein